MLHILYHQKLNFSQLKHIDFQLITSMFRLIGAFEHRLKH